MSSQVEMDEQKPSPNDTASNQVIADAIIDIVSRKQAAQSDEPTECWNGQLLAFRTCFLCRVPLYIHVFLPLFFGLSFIVWMGYAKQPGIYVMLVFVYNFHLWISVLIHEMGHVAGVKLFGGRAHSVILNLFGGATRFYTDFLQDEKSGPCPGSLCGCSRSSSKRLWVHLMGPLMHVPQMAFWLALASAVAKTDEIYDDFVSTLWKLKIVEPFWDHIGINFCEFGLVFNFILFVSNLFWTHPLDGSFIFVNGLRVVIGENNDEFIEKAYVFMNVVSGLFFIIFPIITIDIFTIFLWVGLWMLYEAYKMVKCMRNYENHPVMQ